METSYEILAESREEMTEAWNREITEMERNRWKLKSAELV